MWPRIACLLILGYLGLSRAFAYLGVPAWNLFVSEIVLAFLLLFGPKIDHRPWMRVMRKQPTLRHFLTCYGLFLMYGIIQVFHGISAGYPPLTALRDLAFNYYPIYFFLGLWAGLMRPDLLPRLIRGFAWFNGIYGVLFILYLNRVEWFVPGVSADVAPVRIFGGPIYSFVALLGLLVYEKNISRRWYLLLLNGFVMLGMQIRTEWLAFAIGVVIWAVLTRQGMRVLQAGAVVASLLAIMYITDFRLPSPQGRGEEDISAGQLIHRALAPFRADLGDQTAAAGGGGVDQQEATVVFRTVWWIAIWNSVHSDLRTAVWGYGYGFPLGDLVPYIGGVFIRTPHNEFFFALGYTGWIGVVLFALFQIAIFRLLWNAYRVDGRPFGIVFWVSMMMYGMFTAFFETPYGAIPFYLIAGWSAARAVYAKRSSGGEIALPHSAKLSGVRIRRQAYDRAALESRILPGLEGLQVRSQWTIWRESVLPVRTFKKLGENVQGVLGFLNPLLSRWCNRCASAVVDEIPGCYGEIHSATDLYGDLVLIAEKEAA